MADKVKDELLKRKLISEEHAKEAETEQLKSGEPIGKILLRKGYIREEDLSRALAEQFSLPFIRFGKFLISKDVVEKVPAKLAMHYKMMPVRVTDQVLTVAISDPHDVRVLDDIRVALKSKYRIEAALATESDILAAIKRYYGLGAETVEGILRAEDKASAPAPEEEAEVEDIEKLAGDASIVKLVN